MSYFIVSNESRYEKIVKFQNKFSDVITKNIIPAIYFEKNKIPVKYVPKSHGLHLEPIK